MTPIITLLTDFGTRDAYVGAMKGVILQIAPKVTIVDISHEIEPQNVTHGAFVLRQAAPWFPPGTIHVAVVDPGVGSNRRLLAGRFGGQIVVAPDNGLITLIHRDLALEEMRVIDNRRIMLPRISSTFHGRDILVPAAAHLANGLPMRELGPPTDLAELLRLPRPSLDAEYRLTGTILYVDRFGNLVSNISRTDLGATITHRRNVTIALNEQSIGPLRTAYHEVAPGQPVALIGSADMLEIAIRNGSAKDQLRPEAGARVQVA